MSGTTKRNWLPALLPALLGALVLGLGHLTRAVALFVAAGIIVLLIAVGVDVGAAIGRGVLAVGRGLSVALAGLLFVVAILPASAWSSLRRRGIRGRRNQPNEWSHHRAIEVRPGSLGSAARAGVDAPRGLAGRLTWAVGCVVLVLAANYGAGWAWDQVAADEAPTATTADPTVTYDPRADLEAMAAYPWRHRYFADIQRAPVTYWPYTQFRPEPFRSPYLNVDGWTRQSYRAPGRAAGRPRVWMFGGSTTWGEGQRDRYTIASWLARMAEDDGVPIEIENYGQRGWTHFQEMVLYEQRLALDDPPDLSLFYDGVNEINTQTLVNEPVPSHYQLAEAAEAVDGRAVATRFGPAQPTSSLLSDLWHEYSEHSLVHKLLGRIDEPAGASAAAPAGLSAPAPGGFDATAQDGIDAGQVYERTKRLTLALSDRYDVDTLLFWQPVRAQGEADHRAREQLTDPTIDISDLLLDRQDVFIDGGHTNEEGARLVAERIWADLGPAVRAWYEAER